MIIKTIRKNKILILLFVLVIFIFGTPHIININEHGYDLYNPVPAVNGYVSNLDEILYLPGFRDVIDGHYIVKSPQLKEYKNSVNHIDIIPYFLLGISAALFGASVKEIFIISDFIFPAIGFVLLYFLLRKVFDIRRDLSILFALLVTIFQSFTNFITGLFNLNSFNFTYAVDTLGQSKLYAPEFVFIFLIAAIITLYFSFKKEGYVYPVLTIIFGVILVYSYIFYSTFYWTAFGLFSLYLLITNRKNIVPKVKKILFIAIPSAVLSLPFLFEFLAFKSLESYPDILLRSGVEVGRFIHLPLIFAVVSIIFLAVTYKVMKNRFKFYFVASMIISTIIWSNMQIVTGFNIQPFHWTYRISEVLYFVLAVYILQEGYRHLEGYRGTGLFAYIGKKIIKPIFGFLTNKYLVIIAIVFFIIYGFGYSASAAFHTSDIHIFDNDELELYDWLNKNTPVDSVVLTLSIDQNIKISSYTHNNVYLPNGVFSRWTTEEIVDRIVFLYDIYNVSDDELNAKLNVPNDAFRKMYLDKIYEGERFSLYDFEKYMFIHYPFHWQFFYGHWDYQQQNPDVPGAIGYYFPQEFRDRIMDKRYGEYEVYAHDYVLIGPYEKQIADVDKIYKDFREVYSNTDFSLFVV